MKELKNWILQNWLVVITSLFLLGMNWGILAQSNERKIDSERSREIAVKEIEDRVTPALKKQAQETEELREFIKKNQEKTDEMIFNLKRICESLSVKYIER